jgi:hypothetical protein
MTVLYPEAPHDRAFFRCTQVNRIGNSGWSCARGCRRFFFATAGLFGRAGGSEWGFSH